MWAQQQVGMYVTLICVCVCLFAGSRRTAVCGVEGRRVADKNKQQYVNKAEGLSFHFIKAKWRRSAVATGWSFTRSGKSSNLPCWFYCFVGREVKEEEGVHDCRHEPLSMCILWPNLSPFLCIQTCLLRFEHWGVARPPPHHHPSPVCCLAARPAEEDRWFNLKNILVDRANKLSCLVEPSWSYFPVRAPFWVFC